MFTAVNNETMSLCCSYKEDSEEVTDSDDLVEVDYAEEEFVNNAETIEKVIAQRRGKAGGEHIIGLKQITISYYVVFNGTFYCMDVLSQFTF